MAGFAVQLDRSPAELQTAVLAVRQFGREMRKDLNTWTRETFAPVWKREVHSAIFEAPGAAPEVLAAGVRVKPGNPPQLLAAGIKRRVTKKGTGGGLHPYLHWAGFEYGAAHHKRVYNRKSSTGKSHEVKRVTTHHLTRRRRAGRVYGVATREVIPRMISGWTSYAIRGFMEAVEGGAK